jgi:hypothetical protein
LVLEVVVMVGLVEGLVFLLFECFLVFLVFLLVFEEYFIFLVMLFWVSSRIMLLLRWVHIVCLKSLSSWFWKECL